MWLLGLFHRSSEVPASILHREQEHQDPKFDKRLPISQSTLQGESSGQHTGRVVGRVVWSGHGTSVTLSLCVCLSSAHGLLSVQHGVRACPLSTTPPCKTAGTKAAAEFHDLSSTDMMQRQVKPPSGILFWTLDFPSLILAPNVFVTCFHCSVQSQLEEGRLTFRFKKKNTCWFRIVVSFIQSKTSLISYYLFYLYHYLTICYFLLIIRPWRGMMKMNLIMLLKYEWLLVCVVFTVTIINLVFVHHASNKDDVRNNPKCLNLY